MELFFRTIFIIIFCFIIGAFFIYGAKRFYSAILKEINERIDIEDKKYGNVLGNANFFKRYFFCLKLYNADTKSNGVEFRWNILEIFSGYRYRHVKIYINLFYNTMLLFLSIICVISIFVVLILFFKEFYF